MTLLELMVVVAVLGFLAAMILPALLSERPHAQRINCTNNMKQIGLAFRIWEGDNGDIYSTGIAVTNGGAMEMAQTGNVLRVFLVMSNELNTPKVLVCPEDFRRIVATNFSSLSSTNLSYFAGADVTNESNPQQILSGDSNLQINGNAVKSGLVSISTNNVLSWQPNRHGKAGNLMMADGSAQSATDLGLETYFKGTGVATNRLAIP